MSAKNAKSIPTVSRSIVDFSLLDENLLLPVNISLAIYALIMESILLFIALITVLFCWTILLNLFEASLYSITKDICAPRLLISTHQMVAHVLLSPTKSVTVHRVIHILFPIMHLIPGVGLCAHMSILSDIVGHTLLLMYGKQEQTGDRIATMLSSTHPLVHITTTNRLWANNHSTGHNLKNKQH